MRTQESLRSYTIVVFSVSTTGQGDLPANARTFWKSLLLKKLPATFLSGVSFSWFGLGDSSYPKLVLFKALVGTVQGVNF